MTSEASVFFFSSRRRHTRFDCDWSSDVCSSDLVADRRPYTMNEIVDTVERLLEHEFGMTVAHRRLRLPALASQVAGVADALLQAIGRYQQEVHVLSEMSQTIACSIARAERELGYDPRIELEEGMRRSIRWCLEQGQTI